MKTPTKLAIVAGTAAAGLTFGLVAPSAAGVNNSQGHTNADWDAACEVVTVRSVKDISNVVYHIDGTEHRIEFSDGTHHLQLPGEITDIWVKAGNNKSGDGSGFGEHYGQPERCIPSVVTVENY